MKLWVTHAVKAKFVVSDNPQEPVISSGAPGETGHREESKARSRETPRACPLAVGVAVGSNGQKAFFAAIIATEFTTYAYEAPTCLSHRRNPLCLYAFACCSGQETATLRSALSGTPAYWHEHHASGGARRYPAATQP